MNTKLEYKTKRNIAIIVIAIILFIIAAVSTYVYIK